MSDPLVTIGLPVYNSQRYVRQSIDSLLAQTYRDFVLIISDNASNDGTADICQEYARADSRVQYHRNPVNIGNPGNFNRVFELTKTKYLKWSTSDDLWAPTFVERAVEIMEADSSIALCYPGASIVNSEGGDPQPYDDRLHLMEPDPAERFVSLISNIALVHQHLGLIRMSCLRQTHLLGPFVHSDNNLVAELVLYGKFFELPERLFFRRFHSTSGSWKRQDADHQQKFYLATNAKRMNLVRWKQDMRYFPAVARAPLPLRSKIGLYRFLLRQLRWDRYLLASEVRHYLRTAFK